MASLTKWTSWTSWTRDLRYAARTLRRSPAYAAVAALTLGLGLGATIAIWTVVDAVVLSPLPFEAPDRLVVVWETRHGQRFPVSPANFADWRERTRTFDSLAAVDLVSFNLAAGDRPERLSGARVSADFFRVLRAEPAVGRVFLPGEDRPGEAGVAVLAHDVWRRQFGADPDAVGRRVLLDGAPFTVVGVMPADFEFPYLGDRQDVWVPRPIRDEERSAEGRGFRSVGVIGRLEPGATVAAASDELARQAAGLAAEYPLTNEGWSAEAVGLYEQAVRGAGRNLWFLLGAVAVLLLVALANVANMALAREAARQREVALRVALGGGRGDLVRQLVSEGVVLALAGGVLGLGLAALGLRLLELAPAGLPRASEIALGPRAAVFALGLSLVVGVALGLVPALRLARLHVATALISGGARTGAGSGQEWLRSALLAAETALVLVLLVGGGLMVRGFVRLAGVDPGFASEGRIAAEVILPRERFPERHLIRGFFERVEEEVARHPRVREVGLVSSLPMVPTSALSLGFVQEGKPVDLSAVPQTGYDVVSPGYFRAAGVPLVRGRLLDPSDTADSTPVVVINETMARRFWPGEEAVGRRLQILDPSEPWLEVVGIVGDVRHNGLGLEARPAMYQPLAQMQVDRTAFAVIAQAEGAAPETLGDDLRRAVWRVDRDQAVEIRTLAAVVDASLAGQRFNLLLLNLFAGVALTLGAVGVFGVVSYTVTQRRRQIGIRMALGAQRRDVFRWVTLRALAPVAAGAALGIVLALSLSRVLARLVYEISPTDPATYAGIVAVLLLVALAATLVPARRATRVDPLVALREE